MGADKKLEFCITQCIIALLSYFMIKVVMVTVTTVTYLFLLVSLLAKCYDFIN